MSNLKVILVMITVILHKAWAVTASYKLEQMWGLGCIGWLSLLIRNFQIHVFQQSFAISWEHRHGKNRTTGKQDFYFYSHHEVSCGSAAVSEIHTLKIPDQKIWQHMPQANYFLI